MVKKKQGIKGDIYNLTLNQKSPVRGWNLIVTDDDKEYLMYRNLSLSSNLYRKVYQTDLPMRDCCITEELAKGKGAGARPLAILAAVLSGPVLRSTGLGSYIFGEGNIPVDIFIAIRNISFVAFDIVLFLAVTLS